jgi:hypothetical protein
MNENKVPRQTSKISSKIKEYYMLKLTEYEKLKSESDKFKDLKLQNLSFKNQILKDYVISNYDMSVLKLKDKNYSELCSYFELRNSIILSLRTLFLC